MKNIRKKTVIRKLKRWILALLCNTCMPRVCQFLEDISPFCDSSNTPVFDFWLRLPWILKSGWIPSLGYFVNLTIKGYCVAAIGCNRLWRKYTELPAGVPVGCTYVAGSEYPAPFTEEDCIAKLVHFKIQKNAWRKLYFAIHLIFMQKSFVLWVVITQNQKIS